MPTAPLRPAFTEFVHHIHMHMIVKKFMIHFILIPNILGLESNHTQPVVSWRKCLLTHYVLEPCFSFHKEDGKVYYVNFQS